MNWIAACLVAVATLSCLSDAQFYQRFQTQAPLIKQPPVYKPPRPQIPYKPQPQQPQQPQRPHTPTISFNSCEVQENYKIQCGPEGISSLDCDSINCCFDGQMCYYGKAVTVQCTKDGLFIVVVARDATLPSVDLESAAFLGGGEECSPVGFTSAFVIYQFPVTACGTVMTEEPGVIIYENRMSCSYEVLVGPLGAITRDSTFELLFQCRYVGTSVESLVIEINVIPPPPPVAAPGPLRVDLRLGNGQCYIKGCIEKEVAYSSFYSEADYPITKVLRDPVYVEVRMLERTDPSIVLTLGRCWATSDPNPYSLPQWDLLIDGCPYRDDRYLTTLVPVDESSELDYPSHHKRFLFKMFTFVDPTSMAPLRERVFIHCNLSVCQPTVSNSCEPRCNRKRRDVKSVVGQKYARPDGTTVTSGEVIFVAQQPSQDNTS